MWKCAIKYRYFVTNNHYILLEPIIIIDSDRSLTMNNDAIISAKKVGLMFFLYTLMLMAVVVIAGLVNT
jgi:hypothetical protein